MDSTRYVWEKYKLEEIASGWSTETSSRVVGSSSVSSVVGFPTTGWVGCTEAPILDDNGFFIPQGETINSGIWSGANAIRQSIYNYFMVNNSDENRRKYYYDLNSNAAQWVVQAGNNSNGDGYVDLIMISNQNQHLGFQIVSAVAQNKPAKGEYVGLVSSRNLSAYPEDGDQNGYWYIYKGSDGINVVGIEYSPGNPAPGESITVTVTPEDNNIFGGTIYYKYYYSISGTNTDDFIQVGSETTSTSKTIQIPSDADTFYVGAKSLDGWGFECAAVRYKKVPLEVSKLYVGVNGTARKAGKLYVGVDGKARQVVKGYIGVNGKARRFL